MTGRVWLVVLPLVVACSSDGAPTAAITRDSVSASPVPVARYLAISPAKARIDTGQLLRLEALAQDEQRRPLARAAISWWSSDTTIAAVDAGGVVRARTAGYVVISATSGAATAQSLLQIAVNGEYPSAVLLEPSHTTLRTCDRQAFTARTDPDIGDTRFAWLTSDSTVLRVDDNGAIRGVTPGVAQLTVVWLPDASRRMIRTFTITACER